MNEPNWTKIERLLGEIRVSTDRMARALEAIAAQQPKPTVVDALHELNTREALAQRGPTPPAPSGPGAEKVPENFNEIRAKLPDHVKRSLGISS